MTWIEPFLVDGVMNKGQSEPEKETKYLLLYSV